MYFDSYKCCGYKVVKKCNFLKTATLWHMMHMTKLKKNAQPGTKKLNFNYHRIQKYKIPDTWGTFTDSQLDTAIPTTLNNSH